MLELRVEISSDPKYAKPSDPISTCSIDMKLNKLAGITIASKSSLRKKSLLPIIRNISSCNAAVFPKSSMLIWIWPEKHFVWIIGSLGESKNFKCGKLESIVQSASRSTVNEGPAANIHVLDAQCRNLSTLAVGLGIIIPIPTE